MRTTSVYGPPQIDLSEDSSGVLGLIQGLGFRSSVIQALNPKP